MAWRPQAITWTNVDFSSLRSSDVHLRAILFQISQPSVTKISLKIIFVIFYWNLPGASELRHHASPVWLLSTNGIFRCIFLEVSMQYDPVGPVSILINHGLIWNNLTHCLMGHVVVFLNVQFFNTIQWWILLVKWLSQVFINHLALNKMWCAWKSLLILQFHNTEQIRLCQNIKVMSWSQDDLEVLSEMQEIEL